MKSQSINKEIMEKVSKMKPGEVFDYSYFNRYQDKPSAVAKALSRLAKENRIQRVEKGVYFVPIKSKFGNLRPSETEILKEINRKSRGQILYETGIGAYNKLGLTGQVPNVITLASKKQKASKSIQGIKIVYTKKNFDTSQFDPCVLQILDAMKDIKKIPGSTIDESIPIIETKINDLSISKLQEMKRASYNYPPYVRALLGSIIEKLYSEKEAKEIRRTLNPLTKYSIPISNSTLPNKDKWGIR